MNVRDGFDSAWRERDLVAPDPISPGLFLALAPMDGVTDWVYRDLMTSLAGGRSGISLCVSEFVRVSREPVRAPVILRHCPELAHGGKTAAGVPVFVQLLGGHAEHMAESAATAAELGALGIDINFGCPAKCVNKHDGGAVILKEPHRIETITAAIRAKVPATVTVTVKVRVGWEDASTMEDIAAAAEAGGAAWLTIHGRTRVQGYKPPVDWAAIARARAHANIPVVANGDLFGTTDLQACGQQTQCRAFMIGRGAMADPTLFRTARGWDNGGVETIPLLREYTKQLMDSGASPRAALCRLKQWLRLGAPTNPGLQPLFDHIKRLQVLDDADRVLMGARSWSPERTRALVERPRELAVLPA